VPGVSDTLKTCTVSANAIKVIQSQQQHDRCTRINAISSSRNERICFGDRTSAREQFAAWYKTTWLVLWSV